MISAKPTIFLIFLLQAWTAFSFQQHIGSLTLHTTVNSNTALLMKSDMVEEKKDNTVSSRRSFFQNTMATATTAFIVNPSLALAEEATDAPPPGLFEDNGVGKTLEANIYYILRAREASAQETRLINSGKFKDAQRNNVKLAVKFIVQNYRVSDNIIAASAYIGGAKRIQANEIGQQAVQSLFTILEYFDTSDVQNIRVSDADLAGKIPLVLKGLEVSRSRIDQFLGFFPEDLVTKVQAKIKEENDLNMKEFDPEIGTILNPDPTAT